MPTPNKKATGWLVLASGLMLILIPLLAIFFSDSAPRLLDRVFTRLPTGVLFAIAGCLMVVVAVCVWLFVRMRVASIPVVSLLLFVSLWVSTLVAGAASVRSNQADFQETEPTQLSISGGMEGLTVTCNGVDLGVTPISMSLEEFRQLVPPVDGPPDQLNARVPFYQNQGYQYRNAGWTLVPSRFPGEEVFDFHAFSEPEHVISSRLSQAEYWWSFRGRQDTSRMSEIRWSRSNDRWVASESKWPDARKHVALLVLLGKEEGVNPRVAYTDHIQKYSPPLDSLLEAHFDKAAVEQNTGSVAADLQSSSAAPSEVDQTPSLSFSEAVYRNDLAGIVRSDDPRSVPLIRRHLDELNAKFRSASSLLAFANKDLMLMTESSAEEVADMLKGVLLHADWTDTNLVENFVLRQLDHGADRKSLLEWLMRMKFESGIGEPVKARLMVKLGAENFSTGAEKIGYDELLAAIQRVPSDEVRSPVIKWLVQQWVIAPTGVVLNAMMAHSGHKEVQQAWQKISLQDLQVAKIFAEGLQRTDGWSDHSAVADILVDVIAREITASGLKSDSLNREFAQQLYFLSTPRAIEALRDASKQHRAEESVFQKVLVQCEKQVAADAQRRLSNLQLARDLIAGTKTPQDLIETKDFVWRDGRYQPVQEATPDQ